MTDERFERDLRAFLVMRAPAEASLSLRARIATVPAEAPAASLGWRSRWFGAGRTVVGIIATAALAVFVIALLGGLGRVAVREGGQVGAPSTVTGSSGPPYIDAPIGFFTPGALEAANERLRRVYEETRVEGTLLIQSMPDRDTLMPPDGWQERYDRDGDERRDVVAVAGLTPDETIFCCITKTGSIIDQARRNMAWQPLTQPSALDDELSAATPAERDAALGGFVRGIEALAVSITELGLEPHPGDVVIRLMPAILMVTIVALLVAAVPRRRWARARMSGEATVAAGVERGGRWSTTRPSALHLALLAFGVMAIVTIPDLINAPDTSVPFDASRHTVGIATPGAPILPAVLLAIALLALMAYALQGGTRRRLATIAVVILIFGSGWIAVDASRPMGRQEDIAWVASPNGRVSSHGLDGLHDSVTYDVAPGETFALAGVVRNDGVLPITILGLDGETSTGGDPRVASIVGLGWIPQPDGADHVVMLSASPDAASSGWPVTVAPRSELAVLILGRAGPCAEPGGTGAVLPLVSMTVTYRVLGVELTEPVGLPATVFISARASCS
jgi:hypothetical protein